MKRIIVHFTPERICTAYVADGVLSGLLADKTGSVSLAGNVYAATVQKILPGEFAFVDIGHKKNAFLPLQDKKEYALYTNGVLTIRQGQTILVQVVKDAYGTKGATVTSQLSVQGKNLVLFQSDEREIAISKKIEDADERERLKKVACTIVPEGYGVIWRTNSQGKAKEELLVEWREAEDRLNGLIRRGCYCKPPYMLYGESPLRKTLQSFLPEQPDEVVIDDVSQVETVSAILRETLGHDRMLRVYEGETPVFSEYFLQAQLDKALGRRIWLKSGGSITIEQTEACVVIDVNSAKCIGKKDQHKTAMLVNLEAAVEIARQIRLRNLSGIVIADFISIRSEADKMELLRIFQEEMKKDRVPVNVYGINELGLLQLTRKKIREPLGYYWETRCPACDGTGVLGSPRFGEPVRMKGNE